MKGSVTAGLLIAASLALSACGKGGEMTPAPEAPGNAATTPAPAAPPPAATTPTPAATSAAPPSASTAGGGSNPQQ